MRPLVQRESSPPVAGLSHADPPRRPARRCQPRDQRPVVVSVGRRRPPLDPGRVPAASGRRVLITTFTALCLNPGANSRSGPPMMYSDFYQVFTNRAQGQRLTIRREPKRLCRGRRLRGCRDRKIARGEEHGWQTTSCNSVGCGASAVRNASGCGSCRRSRRHALSRFQSRNFIPLRQLCP